MSSSLNKHLPEANRKFSCDIKPKLSADSCDMERPSLVGLNYVSRTHRNFFQSFLLRFRHHPDSILRQHPCHHHLDSSYLRKNRFHTSALIAAPSKVTRHRNKHKDFKVPKKAPVVEIWRGMTVLDLATAVDKPADLIADFVAQYTPGEETTDNSSIRDDQIVHEVVRAMSLRPRLVQPHVLASTSTSRDAQPRPPPSEDELIRRHPVVTIMGHVDHGKTTLLDRLRKTNVVSQEFGGITQHIGAFSVRLSSGAQVTFFDTPGHAAFAAMRGRGAGVTDIVILVVAGEDGVMNQTVESIGHARAAGVPVIVAINKIDKPSADVEATKRQLLEHDVVVEDFGGDVMCVPISAFVGTNVDQLIEAVLTQAELLNLRADPTGLVEGTVIETRQVDDGRGKLATVLIQRGTLKPGALLVAGTADCRTRNMSDHAGQTLTDAKPFVPVEIMGWKELPSPGDLVLQVETEKRQKQVLDFRKSEEAQRKFLEAQSVINERLARDMETHKAQLAERLAANRRRIKTKNFQRAKESKTRDLTSPQLDVILCGDADGSLEAILDVFDSYASTKCKLEVTSFGVGPPTPTDVLLAADFDSVIYCFNITVPDTVQEMATVNKVDIRHFNIIYRLFEDMKTELGSRLQPVLVEDAVGEADVMQPYLITDENKRKRPVAGSTCVKGQLVRSSKFKLIRNGDVLFDGPLHSLRHFKEEVTSIPNGMDCGIALGDIEVAPMPGDTVLCYDTREERAEIDWDLDF